MALWYYVVADPHSCHHLDYWLQRLMLVGYQSQRRCHLSWYSSDTSEMRELVTYLYTGNIVISAHGAHGTNNAVSM